MSQRGVIGITPARLVRPTVGLSPTTELWSEGQMMELCVSLPRETEAMFAATDIADPLLDPHGVPDDRYGFYNIIKKRMETIATRHQEHVQKSESGITFLQHHRMFQII